MMRWALVLGVLAGCASTAPSRATGGAGFREVPVAPSSVSMEAMGAICWPQDALSDQRVRLTWQGDDVVFEVSGGASNSTGRCLREIASSYVWASRPKSPFDLAPPRQPIDGWSALAWVKLLSAGRYGPERGLVDPAPVVRGCLGNAPVGVDVVVRHVPGPQVRVVGSSGEAARCVEAVLGSTAWPAPKELFLTFAGTRGAPEAQGEVTGYFGPSTTPGPAMDAQLVRQVIHGLQARVGVCWEAALTRRASLGGARTFRFSVDAHGEVRSAWVSAGLGDGPGAADYLLDQCLGATLKEARFPGGPGEGVYTWVFASR